MLCWTIRDQRYLYLYMCGTQKVTGKCEVYDKENFKLSKMVPTDTFHSIKEIGDNDQEHTRKGHRGLYACPGMEQTVNIVETNFP